MGWLYTDGQTKEQLVNKLIKPYASETQEQTCLRHSLVGSNLWAVFEVKNIQTDITRRYIALFLIAKERGYGYGYKDMDESMGPYYYNCPVYMLKMVDEVNHEWREGVKKYHAIMNQKHNFKIGDKLKLTGTLITPVTLYKQVSKNTFNATDSTGRSWKITKKFLNTAELIQ